MDHIQIFDTTLRDGEQSPGFSMTVPEKLRLARQLADLGVDVIEVASLSLRAAILTRCARLHRRLRSAAWRLWRERAART